MPTKQTITIHCHNTPWDVELDEHAVTVLAKTADSRVELILTSLDQVNMLMSALALARTELSTSE